MDKADKVDRVDRPLRQMGTEGLLMRPASRGNAANVDQPFPLVRPLADPMAESL